MERKRRGRSSIFSEKVRKDILAALQAGATNQDACAVAGVGVATFYEWLAIGNAALNNTKHARMPRDADARLAFAEFTESVKKAQATARFRGVATIQSAGQDRWVHAVTGEIRTKVPPPVTWMNKRTGELLFENPASLSESSGEWEKQWSGEVWRCERGDWKALAWYLERSDFEHWGRRARVDHFDWRVEAVQRIKELNIPFDVVEGELGHDLAVELFESAGVPIARTRESSETHRA